MNKIIAYACFIAILPLPYVYYILLRPLVALGIVYLLVKDWKFLTSDSKAICIVIAILFNPISAIFFPKLVWVIIDIIVGMYFLNKYPINNKA